jgi:hypothetical protein
LDRARRNRKPVAVPASGGIVAVATARWRAPGNFDRSTRQALPVLSTGRSIGMIGLHEAETESRGLPPKSWLTKSEDRI